MFKKMHSFGIYTPLCLVFQISKMIGAACIIIGHFLDSAGMSLLYIFFACMGILFASLGT